MKPAEKNRKGSGSSIKMSGYGGVCEDEVREDPTKLGTRGDIEKDSGVTGRIGVRLGQGAEKRRLSG